MIKIKKTVALILCLSLTIISTGCWNYKELTDMLIVTSAMIDKDMKTGDFIVSVELLQPEQEDITGKTEKGALISAKGTTIFEAIRNIIHSAGKKHYWSHTKI